MKQRIHFPSFAWKWPTLVAVVVLLHVSTPVEGRSRSSIPSSSPAPRGSKGKVSSSTPFSCSNVKIPLLSSIGAVLDDIANIRPHELPCKTKGKKNIHAKGVTPPTTGKAKTEVSVGVAVAGIALSGAFLLVDSSQEHVRSMIHSTRVALTSLGQVIKSKYKSCSQCLSKCMKQIPSQLERVGKVTGKGLESILNVCITGLEDGFDVTLEQCTKLAHVLTNAASSVGSACVEELWPAMVDAIESVGSALEVTTLTILDSLSQWALLTIGEFKNFASFTGQVLDSILLHFTENFIPVVNLALSHVLDVVDLIGQFSLYYAEEIVYFGGIGLQFLWKKTKESMDSISKIVSSMFVSLVAFLGLVPRVIGNVVQSFGSLVGPSLYLIANSPLIFVRESGHFLLSLSQTILSGVLDAIENFELPVEWVDVKDDAEYVPAYMSVPLGFQRKNGRTKVLVLKPGAQKVLFVVTSLTGVLEVVTNIARRSVKEMKMLESLVSSLKLQFFPPRTLFLTGALARGLSETTRLKYLFSPTIGVGALINIGSLIFQERWIRNIVIGWYTSSFFWTLCGAKPPGK